MLIFAAVAYDRPQEKETIFIEETIFYRIGAGDKTAFCELYEKTRNAVFSYALSLLCNREDAEDAMQEAYLKIRSAAHLYQPMGKPMAWVFTIARNVRRSKRILTAVTLKTGRTGSFLRRPFISCPGKSVRSLFCMQCQD